MRISRPQMFMEFARTCSKRSTCGRLNVGAVIVKDNNVISIGYNGPASGEEHCQGNACKGFQSQCSRAVHAEANALMRMPKTIRGPFTMYCTHSPCDNCAYYLDRSGYTFRIIFETPFRNTDHLKDIPRLFQLTPAGYLMNWKSGELISDEESYENEDSL